MEYEIKIRFKENHSDRTFHKVDSYIREENAFIVRKDEKVFLFPLRNVIEIEIIKIK